MSGREQAKQIIDLLPEYKILPVLRFLEGVRFDDELESERRTEDRKESRPMETNLAYTLEPREEIIGGRVVMMAPASLNHGRIVRNVGMILGTFLRGHPCEYFPDGVGVFLEDDAEEYQPDGMVVCDRSKLWDDGIHGAPDLVVEVLSPGTMRYDRGRKKDVYEKHGVREYWIINPLDLSIEQYVLENGRFVLREALHQYTAEALLNMKEKDRAKVVTEFQCGVFGDLTVLLDDVFGRVVVR